MKAISFALLVLTSVIPLQADENLIQNGDFTDGITHWRGNGRTPADFAPANPFDKPDPFTSKGLIIPLRHRDWDKVAQDFKGKNTSGVLTITYRVAPDLVFSDKAEDYQNMPYQLHYDGWQPVATPPANWVVFLTDFGTTHGTYWTIAPKLGSGDVQTFSAQLSGLTPFSDKTITLGFPPGSGNLVILSVTLTTK
jgi:hypothetical protein